MKRIAGLALAAVLMGLLAGCGGGGSKPPVKAEYTLSITVEGEGTVTPASGTKYKSGTVVELTATPGAGSVLGYWGGPDGALVQQDGAIYKLVMDGNKSLEVRFTRGLAGRVIGDRTGKGLAGVTVSSGAGSAVTDAYGYWELADAVGETTVTPAAPADALGIVVDAADRTATAPAGGVDFAMSWHEYLFQWGSTGSGAGQFNGPAAVALDATGDVYVVDTNNHRVQKFRSDGTYVTEWGGQGTGDGQFDSPTGVAVDASGNVYISDGLNHRVQKFSRDGTYLAKWGTNGSLGGQFNTPGGLAVDTGGNVYAVDMANHRVQKFSRDGGFLTQWGGTGSDPGDFGDYPTVVVIEPSGNVLVADSGNGRIQRFSPLGDYLGKWGSLGGFDGQVIVVNGMAVDAAGRVYVADTALNRIQKFTAAGDYLTKWGESPEEGPLDGPMGVAIDPAGFLYVTEYSAEHDTNRVRKYAIVD